MYSSEAQLDREKTTVTIFGEECGSAWFCQHARRCFACDAHSCEELRATETCVVCSFATMFFSF